MRKSVLLIMTVIALVFTTVTAAAGTAASEPQKQWEINVIEIEAYFKELTGQQPGTVSWQVGEIAGSAKAQNRVRVYGTADNVQKMHTITLAPDTASMVGDTLFGIQTHEYLHVYSHDEALTEFVTWLVCLDAGKNYVGAFNPVAGMTYVYDADRYMDAYLKSGLTPKEAVLLFTRGELMGILAR